MKRVCIFLLTLFIAHTLIPGAVSITYDIKTESSSVALNKPCCCKPKICDCGDAQVSSDHCGVDGAHASQETLRSQACSDDPLSQSFAFTLKKQWMNSNQTVSLVKLSKKKIRIPTLIKSSLTTIEPPVRPPRHILS